MTDARNSEIRRAQEKAKYNDTLILQKINASHRLAFGEKYPNQVEHILRLITERLQNGLAWNRQEDAEADRLSVADIHILSQAMLNIHTIRKDVKGE